MKYVGKSFPIHDASSKAAGRAVYAGDMELKGMLHMALLFSSIPHGIVKELDCSKALEMPGVVDVIHCFNTIDTEYNQYQTQFGQDLLHTTRAFNSHVRYVGDRIAAVIAETEEIARAAVSQIRVEYEELPYSLTMEDTLTGKIDNIHETGAVFDCPEVKVGEKPEGDDLVEIHTTTDLSRVNHICMETHACVADYEPFSGQLTVWSPNQTVYGIRTVLGDIFHMDYNRIRVIKTTMGGSFGGKQEWVLEPVAAAAALRVGRPVKLVYNRNETIASTYSRAPFHFDSTFTFQKDGTLMGIETDFMLDAGAYLGNSINYAKTIPHKMYRAYHYPYLRVRPKVVLTNTIISGAFRGWTSPEATVMFEHNMDMAAKKLGIDPVDLRIKNVMHLGDVDPLSGVPIGNFKAEEALRQGREHFNWDARRKEVQEFNAGNKRFKRGVGMSFGAHVNSFYPSKTDYARVDMRLAETGSVSCNLTLHDHGCGTVQAFRIIAAEALGIPLSKVLVGEGDTMYTPLDVGCFSSRTTYVQGRAAVECAGKFKERLRQDAALLSGVPAEELVVEGETVHSAADPQICYTWSQIADQAQQVLKHEVFVSYEYIPESNPGVGGAHFAMVEVDTYTGMTKILDYLAVHDIGQAINREMCVAQVQGAVTMGSGAALSEHVITRANGKPANSLKDYHVLNSFEAPDVKVELIEDGGTEGPYGAKSIGEVCHTPVAAAVVSAVNHALDSDMDSIPLSPDVIVNYLREREDA
ncbi:MAG: xanthine dehydrogenase family protein molybdopterin-binding subunit [Lachnospiraceae bacterium]|nr:xanthine dehydrogenase family protein molybdopterin-binding subunit [Lachnospiraceae bacterium]